MKNINKKKALQLLGKRIRELRVEQDISQAQLAFEVEVSREHITRIEQGLMNPTFHTLYKIAQALNIEFPGLFTFLEK